MKNGEIFKARPTIRVNETFDIVDNPGKDLKIMRFDDLCNLAIYFNLPNSISAPWNLSFSSIITIIASTLTFQVNPATQTQLKILWTVDGVTFTIYHIHGQIEYTKYVSGLSPTDLHHISIEYVDNKLYFWVNGVQEIIYRSLNLELVSMVLCGTEMGILSFYNRNLNKHEIIQHFIDYHVKKFTNDEVLI